MAKKTDEFELYPHEADTKLYILRTLVSLDEYIGLLKENLSEPSQPTKLEPGKVEWVNIKPHIDKFNDLTSNLIKLYNTFAKITNNMEKTKRTINTKNLIENLTPIRFNTQHLQPMSQIVHVPLVLTTYDFPVSSELVNMLENLKNSSIDLYRKVTSIPKMIPVLDPVTKVELDIENDLRVRGKI